jgi:hypothetical protein
MASDPGLELPAADEDSAGSRMMPNESEKGLRLELDRNPVVALACRASKLAPRSPASSARRPRWTARPGARDLLSDGRHVDRLRLA